MHRETGCSCRLSARRVFVPHGQGSAFAGPVAPRRPEDPVRCGDGGRVIQRSCRYHRNTEIRGDAWQRAPASSAKYRPESLRPRHRKGFYEIFACEPRGTVRLQEYVARMASPAGFTATHAVAVIKGPQFAFNLVSDRATKAATREHTQRKSPSSFGTRRRMIAYGQSD
jgi:hypothetical protein